MKAIIICAFLIIFASLAQSFTAIPLSRRDFSKLYQFERSELLEASKRAESSKSYVNTLGTPKATRSHHHHVRYLDFLLSDTFVTQPNIETIDGFVDYFGLSLSEISGVQHDALNFYHHHYGINITGAIFNPDFTVILPNAGAFVYPVEFNATWPLVMSNPHVGDSDLKVAEFPLQFFPGSVPIYGGEYGQWLLNRGLTLQGNNSDVLSFGLYGIDYHHCPFDEDEDSDCNDIVWGHHGRCTQVLGVETTFPTLVFGEVFGTEKTHVISCRWGTGNSFTNINTYVPINSTLISSQMNEAWRFPVGEAFTTSD